MSHQFYCYLLTRCQGENKWKCAIASRLVHEHAVLPLISGNSLGNAGEHLSESADDALMFKTKIVVLPEDGSIRAVILSQTIEKHSDYSKLYLGNSKHCNEAHNYNSYKGQSTSRSHDRLCGQFPDSPKTHHESHITLYK